MEKTYGACFTTPAAVGAVGGRCCNGIDGGSGRRCNGIDGGSGRCCNGTGGRGRLPGGRSLWMLSMSCVHSKSSSALIIATFPPDTATF